jgi:hypothetical protein
MALRWWSKLVRGVIPDQPSKWAPAGKPRRPAAHLGVEPLESRTLPATLIPVLFHSPQSASCVAVGDFNGDGKPDLAVGVNFGLAGGGVNILLGKGDGTFRAPIPVNTGVRPTALVVGDFNRDGKQDLAVLVPSPVRVIEPLAADALVRPWPIASGQGLVLLGKGDGTFGKSVPFTAGVRPTALAVGDFNGDGKPDLAVADQGFFPPVVEPVTAASNVAPVRIGRGGVNVLLGNGDGSFRNAATYPFPSPPTALAVGDFNGDGRPDLAVVTPGQGSVSVLPGDGKGGFGTAASYRAGAGPVAVAVGDFNRDGKPDLVVADQGVSPTDLATAASPGGGVSVLLNKGSGTFRPAVGYGTGTSPFAVAVGDFDGDGKPDLAALAAGPRTAFVSLLSGTGTGTFRPAVNRPVPAAAPSNAVVTPAGLAAADFNGDRVPDLAVVVNETATKYPAGTHFAVTGPGPVLLAVPVVVPAGTPYRFTLQVLDAGNRPEADYRGQVHLSSTDPLATLPPDYTFTAADAGQHTFTVNPRTAGPVPLTITDTADGDLTLTITVTAFGGPRGPTPPVLVPGNDPASGGGKYPLA